MSRVLAIPDVHLKPWMFTEAEEVLRKDVYDNVVLLGDLVDDFGQGTNLALYEKTMDVAISFINRYKALFCWGNHDISYPWTGFETGYSVTARELIIKKQKELLETVDKSQIAFIHRIDNTLFSHAGLTEEFMDEYLPNDMEIDIDLIIDKINKMDKTRLWTDYSPLWARPQKAYRTGRLYPENKFQVVGHTPMQKPTEEGMLLSLDTYSTDQNGRPIGDHRLICVDTETGAWDYASPEKSAGRGYQNVEAARRLKMLGLPDDIVLCSCKGQKRRLGKAELYTLKEIEKKYGIVIYHLILTQKSELPDTFDDRQEYAYLYISGKSKNWEEECFDLQNGTPNVILENNKEGIRPGRISFQKAKSGGFIRVPIIDSEPEGSENTDRSQDGIPEK